MQTIEDMLKGALSDLGKELSMQDSIKNAVTNGLGYSDDRQYFFDLNLFRGAEGATFLDMNMMPAEAKDTELGLQMHLCYMDLKAERFDGSERNERIDFLKKGGYDLGMLKPWNPDDV